MPSILLKNSGLVSGHDFSRAAKSLILLIPRGLQPTRNLLFRLRKAARRFAITALFVAYILATTPCFAQKINFRDITAQAGIRFIHNNGAFGKKYLPETMGPGCAFIDYDNDGYPDILLINGQD